MLEVLRIPYRFGVTGFKKDLIMYRLRAEMFFTRVMANCYIGIIYGATGTPSPNIRSSIASLRALSECDMTDADILDGHLAACFDTFGRSNIGTL